MPKSICTNCQTEFKPYKNGIYVVEMFLTPPQPYKIWSADLWKCRGCENEIVVGFGNEPLAEHFEDEFDSFFEMIKKTDTVVYSYEKPQDIIR